MVFGSNTGNAWNLPLILALPVAGGAGTCAGVGSMRQQQVKAKPNEQRVNNKRPLATPLKLPLRFRGVRQEFGPLLEVGDADRAERKAERDQHAADDLERVQTPA